MTAFMNRSIDLMEGIARATDNRINMNRRGYLYATAMASTAARLEGVAATAQALGSGPVRLHATPSSPYRPAPEHGFEEALTGADIITDASLLRRHFPYLAPTTVAVLHARRAGWLSAHGLGTVMLEAARACGVKLLRGKARGHRVGGRTRPLGSGRTARRAANAGGNRAGDRRRSDAKGGGRHDRRRAPRVCRAPPESRASPIGSARCRVDRRC